MDRYNIYKYSILIKDSIIEIIILILLLKYYIDILSNYFGLK